jgi:hypothetical protein
VPDRAQLGALGWRHLGEIQEMPPGLDNDRSWTGLFQRGVLGLLAADSAPALGGS